MFCLRYANKSFETVKFPAALKTALVTPVYKRSDPCNIENYRAASILSSISKVIENKLY